MADADAFPLMSDAWTSWAAMVGTMRVGDTYTIAGVYHRRTLWQWLRRAPRQLHIFRVVRMPLPTQEITEE